MAGGQFGENYALNSGAHFDSTSVVGTYVQLAGLTANYTRWDTIQCRNSDTIDHHVSFQAKFAATTYELGTIVVPAGSGATTVAPVDALAFFMPSGFHYYTLSPGVTLQVTIEEAVGSGFHVDITAVGGEL